VLLCIAGTACCVAMAMPQVHIVAYCGDLGYGAARGAEMLSLMLACGIVSRLVSGAICDRIGGLRTLLLGSFLQGVALLLFIPFDGLVSLYVVSALFGLFQGGIVPSYAIIVREHFPPAEAGARVGTVIMFTLFGMALGGWMSGKVFDLTGSYHAAFINGIGLEPAEPVGGGVPAVSSWPRVMPTASTAATMSPRASAWKPRWVPTTSVTGTSAGTRGCPTPARANSRLPPGSTRAVRARPCWSGACAGAWRCSGCRSRCCSPPWGWAPRWSSGLPCWGCLHAAAAAVVVCGAAGRSRPPRPGDLPAARPRWASGLAAGRCRRCHRACGAAAGAWGAPALRAPLAAGGCGAAGAGAAGGLAAQGVDWPARTAARPVSVNLALRALVGTAGLALALHLATLRWVWRLDAGHAGRRPWLVAAFEAPAPGPARPALAVAPAGLFVQHQRWADGRTPPAAGPSAWRHEARLDTRAGGCRQCAGAGMAPAAGAGRCGPPGARRRDQRPGPLTSGTAGEHSLRPPGGFAAPIAMVLAAGPERGRHGLKPSEMTWDSWTTSSSRCESVTWPAP
jgi:hypothetical protein